MEDYGYATGNVRVSTGACFDALSKDTVGEILKRVSIQDIARFACVSKLCRGYADDATKARSKEVPVPVPPPAHEGDPLLRRVRFCEAVAPPRTIAAGANFSLCLRDGALYSWGANNSGELGLGAASVLTPQQVQGVQPRSVSAGYGHTMLLDEDGSVRSCGSNGSGQLGRDAGLWVRPWDSAPSYGSPTPGLMQFAPVRILQVAAGNHNTLMLTAAGGVLAFGDDSYGQLGLGERVRSADAGGRRARRRPPPVRWPTPVAGFDGLRVVELSAGFMHSVAVDEQGGLWAWGSEPGVVVARCPTRAAQALRGKVRHASAGGQTLAVTTKGELYAWGGEGGGQLGLSLTGVSYQSLPPLVRALKGKPVRQACAGLNHNVVLTEAGDVYTWGKGVDGLLGQAKYDREYMDGLYDRILEPTLVETLAPLSTVMETWEKRQRDKETWHAPSNLTKEKVEALDYRGLKEELERRGVRSVGPKAALVARLLEVGPAKAAEATSAIAQAKAAAIAAATERGRVVEVATNSHHTLARTSNGAIFSWGRGALGHGDDKIQITPKEIYLWDAPPDPPDAQ
jgi:alpha-tubulin suppressor-like RCC1 family protein